MPAYQSAERCNPVRPLVYRRNVVELAAAAGKEILPAVQRDGFFSGYTPLAYYAVSLSVRAQITDSSHSLTLSFYLLGLWRPDCRGGRQVCG